MPLPLTTQANLQQAGLEWRQALRSVREDPFHYERLEREEAAQLARARDIVYWREPCALDLKERGAPCAPIVELRPQDNPHLTVEQLVTPWSSGGNPPLAVLWVTPRQIEAPEHSGVLDWIGFLTPVVAIIFPPAGVVMAVAIAGEQREAMQKQIDVLKQIPTTAFDPAYYPQSFAVLLPLPDAQLSVREPWFLPGLVRDFQAQLENMALAEAQALTGSVGTLQPSLTTTPAGALAQRRATGEALQDLIRGNLSSSLAPGGGSAVYSPAAAQGGGVTAGSGILLLAVGAIAWLALRR
jgi:hypothetical protein